MTITGELDTRFSSEDAAAASWQEAQQRLANAQVYWLTTVRPDGRPHVTPLIAVWHQDALHFCTGPDERKARNLQHNSHCALTTGCNLLQEGMDLVVEGEAIAVTDEQRLRQLAREWEGKYGPDWHFDVRDGAFHGEGGRALVFQVRPAKVLGFGKGEPYSQTRFTF